MYPGNVSHANVDLGGDPSDIANQLQGVEAEYLFFAAYIQKDTDEENWEANGKLVNTSILRTSK